MPRHELMMMLAQGFWVLFVFALGACAGSLINVLAYRMPLGLDVVFPSSRCPACTTKLSWRDNIPILGWIILRGRCRYCRSKISPEYPIVETLCAVLFAGLFVLWYIVPPGAEWLDVRWDLIRPEWARQDVADRWPLRSWPEFIILITLVGSLLAMTLIDAKTFTIPLSLPWIAAIVAIVFHTGHAALVQRGALPWRLERYSTHTWALPTPETWRGILAALGGVAGIGLSMLMLKFGLISRSFADYDEWEQEQLAALPKSDDDPGSEPAELAEEHVVTRAYWVRALAVVLGMTALAAIVGALIAMGLKVEAWKGLAAGVLAGPVIATLINRFAFKPDGAPGADEGEMPAEMWIQYPHARREMVKEMAFLAVPAGLAFLAWSIGGQIDGVPPLFMKVLGGALLGLLIGGVVVWGVRILGSFAFGKEAMGLGDVHLMAGVGACCGWIDASLAFFGAAFVGLYWTFVSLASGKVSRAMPYGPYLAAATLLVIVGKVYIEGGLSTLLGNPVNLP